MCIILYDERITKYNRMQDISILLDSELSAELCQEMAECDIAQLMAHKELCAYNEKKEFVFIHPLVVERYARERLKKEFEVLKRESPEKFLTEIANTQQNIRRIESNIRKKKYKNAAMLESWKNNLRNAELKISVLTELLND